MFIRWLRLVRNWSGDHWGTAIFVAGFFSLIPVLIARWVSGDWFASLVIFVVIFVLVFLWDFVKFNWDHAYFDDLKERLEQPYEDDEGRSWTNVATFEIWETVVSFWLNVGEPQWYGYPAPDDDDRNFDFSPESLRNGGLRDSLLNWDANDGWDLGDRRDFSIYYHLIDWDQLSDELEQSFEYCFPEPDE